ncbi:ABC transporter ATP-binding protein [Desulfobacter hydrogenophilus]|uniref:ABC transporter ATP-binding protein n=1 Tax=Desulfobacter hydrogenophilus TaxID=2291 RepID=A0A328FGW2_9BACT|nr:ABC transporter ATP-binding protein [Desulfobacter hydrogenophilus]NDY71249.1 ABC transporter ATP-binding protein [Desulfobacter hydrogenophilus]QBH15011.1 ABC transporter ATP-binding protein [Desulfobacter hydrogenophilus]RAM02742.1 ABC transporter ATP-binding protein [Desulfobacter hydrogenophilus]
MGYALKDVYFSYETRAIFSGISLEMQSGCFHGILGPNGSGKTTLLDLIAGHLKPENGDILLDGRCLDDFNANELAKKCALVPQDFRVNFPFSVDQVVMMGRYPHLGRFSAPGEKDRELVDQAMAATGVLDFSRRHVTALSGGERQRVVFARALAQNPSCLILDEATSNLDIRHTLALMTLAADRVKNKGLTVISVMQDLNLAARFCQSLLFLKKGRAVAHGPVDQVFTESVIKEVFDVSSRVYFDEAIHCKQVVFLN